MEQPGNQQAPSSLLPAVLDRLDLANPAPSVGTSPELRKAMLADADWRTRAKAVNLPGEHAGALPLESLLIALRDEDVSVRAAAVHALGRSNEQNILPYIAEALHDSEWLVREAAVLTLGERVEQAARETLLVGLGDENEFVREAARMMIEQNELLLFDDDDHISFTNLETVARARHPRRPVRFARPRRVAMALLTALVVVGMAAAWLALLPRLQSSRLGQRNTTASPGAILFKGHYSGGAFFPQWTRDGKRMAFVDDYGNMYVWDASTGKLNRTLTLPYRVDPDPLAAWSWASDGRHIVSYDFTGKMLHLWDALTGRSVFSVDAPGYYWGGRWGDSSNRIAIMDQSNTLQIRNMDTGQVQLTITSAHFQKISSLAWSPNGRMIATSSDDGIVEIWDTATGNRLQSFSDPGKAPQSVQNIDFLYTVWSPDSRRVITSRVQSNGIYNSLQIWDVTSGHKLLTFPDHTSLPMTEQWFSDGKRILSTSANETLIWEAATGHVLANIPNNRSQYPGMPVLSPNEKWLAFSDAGHTIQIWDTSTGREIFTFRGHSANVITSSIAWSPDSAYVSSADTDGHVMVWKATTGKVIFTYKLDFPLQSLFIPTHLAFLVWSPDGHKLAIASDEGTIAVLQGP